MAVYLFHVVFFAKKDKGLDAGFPRSWKNLESHGKKLPTWKVMEKSWNLKIWQKVMEKSWKTKSLPGKNFQVFRKDDILSNEDYHKNIFSDIAPFYNFIPKKL